jgi:hypothetical protein
VSTACVTAPPKANMASRPLASSFICISSFFAGSEMKPIGSKPVAGQGKGCDAACGGCHGEWRARVMRARVHACRAWDYRSIAVTPLPFGDWSNRAAAHLGGVAT